MSVGWGGDSVTVVTTTGTVVVAIEDSAEVGGTVDDSAVVDIITVEDGEVVAKDDVEDEAEDVAEDVVDVADVVESVDGYMIIGVCVKK